MSLGLYKNRLNAYMVNGNKGKIRHIKKQIIDSFTTSPSCFDVLVNGIKKEVHVVFDKIVDRYNLYKVLCRPDDGGVSVGDYIVWNGRDFLCVEVEEDDTIQSIGLIRMCNNTLTFQDEETLKIYTLPCTLQDKTSVYSDGIYQNPYITLASDQILIIVPDNNITNKVAKGMRFIFNNDKLCIYRCTRIDRLTQKGLVKFIMKHDTYDSTKDNLDLNVANYIKTNNEASPAEGNACFIKILGRDEINMLKNDTYTAKTYEGDTETNKEIMFEIDDTSLATIKKQENNECEIQVNHDFKTGKFILKATLTEDEDVFEEKSIRVVGL